MEKQILYVLVGLVILLLLSFVMLFLYMRKTFLSVNRNEDDKSLQLLNQNITALQSNMQQKIDMTNKTINDRLDNAARVISDVSRELGSMSQIGNQLRSFQDFLKAPKLRGGLGEQGLKTILSQSLPHDLYKIQYKFRNNQVVDAIVKIETGIIPIDSKFPLEEFNNYLKAENESEKATYLRDFARSFKKHVDDISKKYILADEGTVDFAFMYLPSETLFFEIVNNQPGLLEYANRSKVIPASPSSFSYYLKTIMIGLEGKKITEMSKQILSTLKIIQSENRKFGEGLNVLDSHISNARKTMDKVGSSYQQLSGKIDQVSLLESSQSELIEEITSVNDND